MVQIKQYDTYIGIDPDVTASGVAVWHKPTRQIIRVQALPFFDLYDYLQTFDANKTVVILEAGYLNRSNRHRIRADTTQKSIAAIGGAVGRNHEVAHKITEMCAHLGITCIPVRPYHTKWTPQTCRIISGINLKASEQDKIDAIRLVFGK